MSQLFSIKGDFRIIRLEGPNAQGSSDYLRDFRHLILENETMYLEIERWFDEKVIPGIRNSQRVGYIGYLDGVPAVSSVVKRGESSKFCHLRIRQDLQDKHLGEVFFSLMGLEAKDIAEEVHFTLPESVWGQEREFFISFGFDRVVKAGHQYRLFEDELRCSAPFEKVWNAILQKLPKIARSFSVNGHSFDTKLLMSIRPEHAGNVLSGKKRVEVRRRFSKKWSGCRVSIYASHPQCSVVGDALIQEVTVDNPKHIWERFGDRIGCTKEQFNSYAHSADELYAIILEDVIPYDRAISLSEASHAVNAPLRPPQNYCGLETNKGWAQAVSIGALLQRSFGCGYKLFI